VDSNLAGNVYHTLRRRPAASAISAEDSPPVSGLA